MERCAHDRTDSPELELQINYENANRTAIRHSGMEVAEHSLNVIIQYIGLAEPRHAAGLASLAADAGCYATKEESSEMKWNHD